MNRLRAASFFTGIGGIDLALVAAGFDIALQCEIDEHCQQVLRKHKYLWPDARLKGDIRRVTGKTKRLKHIDLVAGGFPCTGISNAGQQLGIAGDERSGLWYELARIIREARPRVVLLENVAEIVIPGRGGDVVVATLASMGYDAIWVTLHASDVDAPHRRARWFCVAVADGPQKRLQRRTQTGKPDRRRPQTNQFTRGYDQSSKRRNGRYQSGLGRGAHGVPAELYAHRWPSRPNELQHEHEPPRTVAEKDAQTAPRIQALGNAVVPQVLLPLTQAIRDYCLSTQR